MIERPGEVVSASTVGSDASNATIITAGSNQRLRLNGLHLTTNSSTAVLVHIEGRVRGSSPASWQTIVYADIVAGIDSDIPLYGIENFDSVRWTTAGVGTASAFVSLYYNEINL